jgi:hypothetical protein
VRASCRGLAQPARYGWLPSLGLLALFALPTKTASAQTHGVNSSSAPIVLLRVAPEDRHAYLVWNDIPEARYLVHWRQRGARRWMEATATKTSFVVPDLKNDSIYDFQVVANVRDQQTSSPIVRSSPRERTECDPGPFGYFCSVEGLRAYLAQFSAAPYLQCGSEIQNEIEIDSPNCWYRTAQGTAVLSRFFSAEYLPSPTHPTVADIRRVGRHAIWPQGDPFGSPARFSLQMLLEPQRNAGRVDRAYYDEVNSLVVDYGLEIKSRISWFQPRSPVKGRYAIYYEGHGFEAIVDGVDVIQWLLLRGWQVLAVDLPLTGVNTIDRTSPFTEHEDLGFGNLRIGAPMDAFLLPVKALVDSIYLEANNPDVVMLGRSGGGVMGSLYATLDGRIAANVNISGGAPEALVYDTLRATQGDYEQFYAPLLDVVPRDWQLLAGGWRGSFFFYSKFDTCCFRFDETDSWIGYLKGASADWGKTVQVSLDTSRHHGLSAKGFIDLDGFFKAVRLWAPQARLAHASNTR